MYLLLFAFYLLFIEVQTKTCYESVLSGSFLSLTDLTWIDFTIQKFPVFQVLMLKLALNLVLALSVLWNTIDPS